MKFVRIMDQFSYLISFRCILNQAPTKSTNWNNFIIQTLTIFCICPMHPVILNQKFRKNIAQIQCPDSRKPVIYYTRDKFHLFSMNSENQIIIVLTWVVKSKSFGKFRRAYIKANSGISNGWVNYITLTRKF